MKVRFAADLENPKTATIEINGVAYEFTILNSAASISKAQSPSNPKVQFICEGTLGVDVRDNTVAERVGGFAEYPASRTADLIVCDQEQSKASGMPLSLLVSELQSVAADNPDDALMAHIEPSGLTVRNKADEYIAGFFGD
jgi:hypothetical protein